MDVSMDDQVLTSTDDNDTSDCCPASTSSSLVPRPTSLNPIQRMDLKCLAVLRALKEMQTMALEVLNEHDPGVDNSSGAPNTSLYDMGPAYKMQLGMLSKTIFLYKAAFIRKCNEVTFPKEPDFSVFFRGTGRFACKLLWKGDHHRTMGDPTRMRRKRNNREYEVLGFANTDNNLDILERTMVFLNKYKNLRLQDYKKSHPQIPFSKLERHLQAWESATPAPVAPSQYRRMIDSTWCGKDKVFKRTADSIFLLIAIPDTTTGQGGYEYHDPVVDKIVEASSVSKDDLVLYATDYCMQRIQVILGHQNDARQKRESAKEAGKPVPSDQSVEEVTARLMEAQLDDLDVDGEEQLEPVKKRRREDTDS
ncbi:hypothetical protein SCUP234_06534 [Seiridium cupressi]